MSENEIVKLHNSENEVDHSLREWIVSLTPLTIIILWFYLWSTNNYFQSVILVLDFWLAFLWLPILVVMAVMLTIRILAPLQPSLKSIAMIIVPTIMAYPLVWFIVSSRSNSGPNGMALMIPVFVLGGFMLTVGSVLAGLIGVEFGVRLKEKSAKQRRSL